VRRVNLARLNHILIPDTKEGRDRFRHSFGGRLTWPLWVLYHALTMEGRYAVLLWLLVGLAGLDVRSTQAYIAWAALTGLLLGAVFIRRAFPLQGVSLEVHAPPRAAVGEPLSIALELRNGSDVEHQALRIRGPMLPWDGTFHGAPPRLDVLPPRDRRRLTVRASFTARGEHHLDTFMAVAVAPFGLSVCPPVSSGGTRLLVVPRIAPVTSLSMPRTARYQPGGVALASEVGESSELLGVRPYRPGDAVKDLHARTWARLGRPAVREYQQEYFTRFGVVVDTDGTVAGEEELEAALSLAAGVVAHMSRGEALVDLLVVGDEVHELTLGRSLGFLDQALDLLGLVEGGPRLDGPALANRLAPHLRRLSCVVVVALSWDEERAALAEEIQNRGVAARILHVVADGGDASSGGPHSSGLKREQVSAIRSGEELAL